METPQSPRLNWQKLSLLQKTGILAFSGLVGFGIAWLNDPIKDNATLYGTSWQCGETTPMTFNNDSSNPIWTETHVYEGVPYVFSGQFRWTSNSRIRVTGITMSSTGLTEKTRNQMLRYSTIPYQEDMDFHDEKQNFSILIKIKTLTNSTFEFRKEYDYTDTDQTAFKQTKLKDVNVTCKRVGGGPEKTSPSPKGDSQHQAPIRQNMPLQKEESGQTSKNKIVPPGSYLMQSGGILDDETKNTGVFANFKESLIYPNCERLSGSDEPFFRDCAQSA